MKSLKISALAVLLTVFVSCDKGFEELNTNPNLINQISPGTLLNEIVYNMVSNNATNNYNITDQLMQIQLSYPQYYGGVQRYEILESTGNSMWNAGYKWAKNVREMLRVAEENSADNYTAIALTLNAWIYSNLTDCFGNIPFSTASQSEDGILQPTYDTQQSIYEKLLSDLERANSLYDHTIGMAYGTDLLFNNNSKLWQKFTNSLKLRLLLRISDVRPNAYQEMVAMIADPVKYPIIEQQSEAAVFNVTGVTPNLSPWSRALDFSSAHSSGEFFIETLNALNDPRRPVYVTEAHSNGAAIGYKGITSGYDDQNAFQYSPSYMNNLQVVAPMIIPILPYAEVEFIKAELAQKGYLSTDAEQHYKNGIRSAIQLWTKNAVSDDYFNAPLAAYDGSLERIMLHKYLALYFTDYQQWSEYRRTGYPVLPVTTSMLNDGKMPSRLLYPSDQDIYNPENYKKGSESMGGDNINVKVWWDID